MSSSPSRVAHHVEQGEDDDHLGQPGWPLELEPDPPDHYPYREKERTEHDVREDVECYTAKELAQAGDREQQEENSRKQEGGRDPVVDLVGAVEEGEAEGKGGEEEEEERFGWGLVA